MTIIGATLGATWPLCLLFERKTIMSTNTEQEIKKLKAARERWVTRIFWLGIEIAFIFAIPAFVAVWAGNRLGGGTTRTMFLVGAFVLSWMVVIVRYRQMTAKLKSFDQAIADLQNNSDPKNNA